jgi:hypothetical protein
MYAQATYGADVVPAYGGEVTKAKEDHFTPLTSDSSPGSSTYALLDNKEVFLTSANLCRYCSHSLQVLLVITSNAITLSLFVCVVE